MGAELLQLSSRRLLASFGVGIGSANFRIMSDSRGTRERGLLPNSDFLGVCSWAKDSRRRMRHSLKRAYQMPAYQA
jgi:hypothetical protein